MTYQEILQKAFVKAITNGMGTRGFSMEQMIDRWAEFVWTHDFAKAFWGKEKIRVSVVDKSIVKNPNPISEKTSHTMVEVTHYQTAWRAHLQQIVLYENPLEYLEKFL